MTKTIVISIFALGLVGPAFAGGHEGANEGADLAKVETCIKCHEMMGMSLKDSGADAIAAQIKGFASPDSRHDPVMQGASDADIDEVAKLLNERG